MRDERTVLVMTDAFDPTADAVVDVMDKRGVPVFRCDSGDFPQRLSLVAHPGGDGMRGSLTVAATPARPPRSIALEDVGCVYYRRPTAFQLPEHLSEQWRFWALREARMGFGGVVSSLPNWLNHPASIAFAEYKPVQLQAAAACGFSVPRSIVTNDPKAAVEFGREVGETVHKRLSSAVGPGDLFTSLVSPADLDVSGTAHLFQEWIDKAYEVRLTAVDKTCFAVRIDTTSPDGAVDWRLDYEALHYRVIETPLAIRRAVAALMTRFGLRFAAIDFGVTAAGDWHFFEINPNGQWHWLQAATGLRIAEAIADALGSIAKTPMR